jgi:subtilase family serine protease
MHAPVRKVAVTAALLSLIGGWVSVVVADAPPVVAAASAARPLPMAHAHFLRAATGAPPTTRDCRQQAGVACYSPAQMQSAYNLNPLYKRGLDGRGSTIVIVDSFGSPTIANDLKQFDQAFGLPDPPSFNVIQPAGAVPAYPNDPFGRVDRSSWAGETTLDVEWSHAFAPGANILLVETPTSETEGVQGFPEIVQAENYVINHGLGDVISQSFGATEETFPSQQSLLNLRSAFTNAQQHNVTVLGASGDNGSTDLFKDQSCCYTTQVSSWPSSDPLVTSVGGTQLHLDAAGNRNAPDDVWNDIAKLGVGAGASGGGPSHVFSRPAFQDSVSAVVGAARGVPDVSMSAAVAGGVLVYSSFCDYSFSPPNCSPSWSIYGGTSEATPEFAGVVAIADQAAGHRLGWLNPVLYQRGLGGLVDITRGTNTFTFCSAKCGRANEVDTTVPGFKAVAGYDMSSGLGTVDANRFVSAVG